MNTGLSVTTDGTGTSILVNGKPLQTTCDRPDFVSVLCIILIVFALGFWAGVGLPRSSNLNTP